MNQIEDRSGFFFFFLLENLRISEILEVANHEFELKFHNLVITTLVLNESRFNDNMKE